MSGSLKPSKCVDPDLIALAASDDQLAEWTEAVPQSIGT
jgi:hypothetical protein